MSKMVHTVTLWLAWYRDKLEKDTPGRPLRLRMLHASSMEEARQEMQRWLTQHKLEAKDLERLEASPYGLKFPVK